MPTQVLNSGAGIEDSGLVNTYTALTAKPFITEEMAEKMIRAATVIIDTTNSIKSAVA